MGQPYHERFEPTAVLSGSIQHQQIAPQRLHVTLLQHWKVTRVSFASSGMVSFPNVAGVLIWSRERARKRSSVIIQQSY